MILKVEMKPLKTIDFIGRGCLFNVTTFVKRTHFDERVKSSWTDASLQKALQFSEVEKVFGKQRNNSADQEHHRCSHRTRHDNAEDTDEDQLSEVWGRVGRGKDCWLHSQPSQLAHFQTSCLLPHHMNYFMICLYSNQCGFHPEGEGRTLRIFMSVWYKHGQRRDISGAYLQFCEGKPRGMPAYVYLLCTAPFLDKQHGSTNMGTILHMSMFLFCKELFEPWCAIIQNPQANFVNFFLQV